MTSPQNTTQSNREGRDARLEALVNDGSVDAVHKESISTAIQLCIQLEFLAGLPSPKREKDQRMKEMLETTWVYVLFSKIDQNFP